MTDDPPLARPSDPWTSHAAIPSKAQLGAAQFLFLRTLADGHRPMNRYEVSDRASKDGLWKRANELVRKGFIRVVGHNYSPRSNKHCETLEVTPAGLEFLRMKGYGKKT